MYERHYSPAELAGIVDMIAGEKRRALQTASDCGAPSALMLELKDQKAKLERKIAEYSEEV